MNNELDVMSRLVDYHDHISAPSVPVADDLRRGRRRVRRNRGLLAGGWPSALPRWSRRCRCSPASVRLTARSQSTYPRRRTDRHPGPDDDLRLADLRLLLRVSRQGGLAPATELWDPGDQQLDNIQFDDRFDAVETGLSAYFDGRVDRDPGWGLDR